jgi:alpha-L-fucosidase 2
MKMFFDVYAVCSFIVVFAASLLILFGCNAMAADVELSEQKVDWPTFMGQHDMTSDKLPKNWTEAPHFGNAMVGSMFCQVDDAIRLQVFRADVHDHRDDTYGWTAYSRMLHV